MYQYLIIDEAGGIVYADTDKHHTKQLADVLSMRTGRPHFVDCILATLCAHIPVNTLPAIPEQRLNPPE